jgi:hypothetical protein
MSNVNNAELLMAFNNNKKEEDINDDDDDDDDKDKDNNNKEGDKDIKKDKGVVITEALLNFVDLAGSEKVSNHYQGYKLDSALN